MHDRIAHTAEHAFIGALQRILGQTLRVRKVEHKDSGNTAFIVIPQLDLDLVIRAESEVNSLITEGRKVSERTFESLEEAKKQTRNLRANEERISGKVRVVEIENHDAAACAMEHAENLSECEFFLVTRVSKSGDEYEVDFVVSRRAKEIAVFLSATLLRVCGELGANINTVENTARRIKAEHESNLAKLRALSREKLDGIKPQSFGNLTLFKGVFSNLVDDQLLEFAGKKIKNKDTAVIVGNVGPEMATVVFARDEKMSEMDCNALFRKFAGDAGRGGGKPNFVTGVVKNVSVRGVIDGISDEIMSKKF
ncbi:MAG: hypothetical protein ACREA4_04610 [Nitrososphaera sp.]